VQASAVLEQQPHRLALLKWVERSQVTGIGMAEPNAIPAGTDELGRLGSPARTTSAHPQGKVSQAGVKGHEERCKSLGTGMANPGLAADRHATA
jgi:hypothetical protein